MKKYDIFSFLLYLIGCLLPSMTFIVHFKVLDQPAFTIVLLLLISFCMYLLFHIQKLKRIRWIILIIFIALFILNFNTLSEACMYCFNSVMDVYRFYIGTNFFKFDRDFDPYKIQIAVIGLFALMQMLISYVMSFLFERKKNFLIFIFTLVLSIPSLVFQIGFNWWLMSAQFAFWFLLFIPMNDKVISNWKAKITQFILIILTTCIVASAFLVSFPEAQFKELYHPESIHEDLIERFNSMITYFSTLQMNQDQIDLNKAKNRHYTGAIHLLVTREKKEDLYLKYYSGAVYENNSWKPFEDIRYQKLSRSDFESSYVWIKKHATSEDLEMITVDDLRSGNIFAPIPYYLYSINNKYEMNKDIGLMFENNDQIATYQIWDPAIVNINMRQGNYADFVARLYSNIDTNIRDFFREKMGMKKENLSVEEAENRILSILSEYTYTLSPGATPSDEDFLEYFLLENKKGYCVHFATAATLMFRYYGIPARYVEGYYVKASQFDSQMQAKVKDSDAHAWVEVFDEKLGWIPIEVTKSSSSSSNDPINNGTNPQNPPSQSQNNQNDPTNDPQNPSTDNKPDQNTDDPNQGLAEPIDEQKKSSAEWIYVISLILLILLYEGLRRLYIHRRLKKCTQEDRHQAVYEIYDYLRKIEKYGSIMSDDMRKLFEKNRFSKDGLSKEEYQMLFNDVTMKAKTIYKSLPWHKKIIFKYIKFLI